MKTTYNTSQNRTYEESFSYIVPTISEFNSKYCCGLPPKRGCKAYVTNVYAVVLKTAVFSYRIEQKAPLNRLCKRASSSSSVVAVMVDGASKHVTQVLYCTVPGTSMTLSSYESVRVKKQLCSVVLDVGQLLYPMISSVNKT